MIPSLFSKSAKYYTFSHNYLRRRAVTNGFSHILHSSGEIVTPFIMIEGESFGTAKLSQNGHDILLLFG